MQLSLRERGQITSTPQGTSFISCPLSFIFNPQHCSLLFSQILQRVEEVSPASVRSRRLLRHVLFFTMALEKLFSAVFVLSSHGQGACDLISTDATKSSRLGFQSL
jgi:hypothetical protein